MKSRDSIRVYFTCIRIDTYKVQVEYTLSQAFGLAIEHGPQQVGIMLSDPCLSQLLDSLQAHHIDHTSPASCMARDHSLSSNGMCPALTALQGPRVRVPLWADAGSIRSGKL